MSHRILLTSSLIYNWLSCRVSLLFAKDSLQGADLALPPYTLCVSPSNIEILFSLPFTSVFSLRKYSDRKWFEIEAGLSAGSFIHPVDSKCLKCHFLKDPAKRPASKLTFLNSIEAKFWIHTHMMSVIEDNVLDSPIALTSACDKLVPS